MPFGRKYPRRHCEERSDVAIDAASERRGSLLTMPNRKEKGEANQSSDNPRRFAPFFTRSLATML
jgi:hypothetical protein